MWLFEWEEAPAEAPVKAPAASMSEVEASVSSVQASLNADINVGPDADINVGTQLEDANASSPAPPAPPASAVTPTSARTTTSTSFTNRLLSWRPGKGSTGKGSSKPPPNTDTKQVFEGIPSLSLRAALNLHSQLKGQLAAIQCKEDPADVDDVDTDGDRSALHWAAARGHVKCVELLREAGGARARCAPTKRAPRTLQLRALMRPCTCHAACAWQPI